MSGLGAFATALAGGLARGVTAGREGQRADQAEAFRRFVQERALQRQDTQDAWQQRTHTESIAEARATRAAAAQTRAAEQAATRAAHEQDRIEDRTFRAQESAATRDQAARFHADALGIQRATLGVAQARERREASKAAGTTAGAKAPKLTEQQQRFGLIAPQLAQADSTISALQAQPPSLGETVASKIPLVGNLFTSERQQRLDQAGDTFAQHYLWGLSGASAPDAEVARVSNSVRKRIGDGNGTVQQKDATRGLMVRGAEGVAGPAAPPSAPKPGPIAQARQRNAAARQAAAPSPAGTTGDPATRWEELVQAGMSKDHATVQVRRELGGPR